MKIYSRLLIVLLYIFSLQLFAQEVRTLTAEDLWNMKRPGSVNVSPDKNFAVFTLSSYDIKENKGTTNLYLINFYSNQIKRLTTHKGSDSSPAWSPDSKTIAFLSRRNEDERNQLYTISIDGGEAERLTTMPLGIFAPKWFPDGNKIAFASSILPEFENDFEAFEKELKSRKESKVTAKVTEDRYYRYWDTWLTEGYVTHLYAYDLTSKERTVLTPGLTQLLSFGSGIDYDISPDGRKIAITINTTKPPYHEKFNFDIFLFDADGKGEMKNITENNPAMDSSPLFTPDGKYLLFLQRTNVSKLAENNKIVRYDLKSGETETLTGEIDLSCGNINVTDDGKEIYFLAEDRAKQSIFRIDVNGKNFSEVLRDGTNSALQLGKDKLYFINQNISQPPAVFEYDLKKKQKVQLTFYNDELTSQITMGKVEEVYFKGADNNDVQMFILYPPGFDAAKKYPLLHLIHGGPHGTFGDDFHFRWNAQAFAAPGYVTAMVNFHGSSSFGEDFAESIVGAHGDKPFTDIMKATDYLLANYGFIDSTKMAAAGGSYGGYLVSWIAGHTDRFATLINHAGVYNLMGQFASDLTHFREEAYGGSPWNGLENVIRYSPAHYAENFTTPMLVIHGEKDYRVVATQGLEVYGVLQGKGIPSRLVYYPDENHWILTPQNSIFWYKEFNNWLERFLK